MEVNQSQKKDKTPETIECTAINKETERLEKVQRNEETIRPFQYVQKNNDCTMDLYASVP